MKNTITLRFSKVIINTGRPQAYLAIKTDSNVVSQLIELKKNIFGSFKSETIKDIKDYLRQISKELAPESHRFSDTFSVTFDVSFNTKEYKVLAEMEFHIWADGLIGVACTKKEKKCILGKREINQIFELIF